MTGRAVGELLAPEYILREVSRFKLPGTLLSDLFGWGMQARDPQTMGGNMIDYPLRDGSYDVFNRTQEVATARVPGQAHANMPPQKVGKVRFTIPRSAERIPLTDEDLVNRRAVGQPVTTVDTMGENYITRQKQYLAAKVANMIEFQTAAMLRGSYTFDQQGDEIRQGFTGGEETIDFQVPSGNKNQLNMLGDGDIIGASWATTTTDIPTDILQINDAMNSLTGMGINHMVMNSNTFAYLLNNTKIQAQAGTSNTPFENYVRVSENRFSVQLKAIPWLQIHVLDYKLRLWNGSAYATTRLIADDQISAFPNPDSSWVQYLNGGEVVTEGPNGVREFRYGAYFYGYPSWDPSGWNLCEVHNGIPALYVPAAIVYGDVTP
jgi:hypothetical protein